MKSIIIKSFFLIFLFAISCKDSFFERLPPAAGSSTQYNNERGIDLLLIGAYSLLDGIGATNNGSAYYDEAEVYVGGAGSNWLFGDVRAGDAAKASDDYDQASAGLIERHEISTTSRQVSAKWNTCYDGVSRCNDVLRAIAATDAPADFLAQKTAEARFLRGHYFFELKKHFNNVVWIDENTTDFKIPNKESIWPKIEEDFKYGASILPATQALKGRATSGAAKAYLAKAYIFQQKWSDAKTLLDGIITSGRYSLLACFRNVSDMDSKNSIESVFAAQMLVNDGSPNSDNGNWGEILNHPLASIEGTCCGFYQPSYDLVNSFQTGADGLPLLDNFQSSEVKNDFFPEPLDSTDPFTPTTTTLDPRLDWTVGRRGVPYLDWGVHPGKSWIRNSSFGGPYLPEKRNFTQAQKGAGSTTVGWAGGANSANLEIIRYADVLLWAAEVEIMLHNPETARGYINQIRRRAKAGCVVTALDAQGKPTTTPAASYLINEYPSFPSEEYAMKALRFERRLELAMEGHRFFDLVRWGVADVVLNRYLQVEAPKRLLALEKAVFVKGKHEYLPIPESEIINTSKGGQAVLDQNPGY